MARYVIRFGRSPSPNYSAAVHLAESIDGYRLERQDGGEQHVVPVSDGQLPLLEHLIALVAGWRSTTFAIDGMLVTRGQLHVLLRMIACHRDRQLSGLSELY